ncbi:hypothetical protein A0H81_12808 [Grifola frondosa]|uniref:Uncharacterized protein n=1 Tax=Grifola frondosa TaxID=5627 RepID=A0A1C7LQG6_GRIFR|nr:hypothetical protein A0H81_12808 [Grifola frondosa]
MCTSPPSLASIVNSFIHISSVHPSIRKYPLPHEASTADQHSLTASPPDMPEYNGTSTPSTAPQQVSILLKPA